LSYRLNKEYTNYKSDKNKINGFNIITNDHNKTIITFKLHRDPLISIIIPVFNQVEYTYRCLKSIKDIGCQYSFELIVINDCSTDETKEVLNTINGIRIIHNKKNSGFIKSCNKAALVAKGTYLVFLNNDTQVLPGWLDELLDTFIKRPDAGIVGSKLLYPDGKLQEAGGIIFQDASGLNYGRNDNPLKPEYNYLREVDYCSGACIMTPSKLFHQLGQFDERYIFGYYEDTDYAFTVRKYNKKVLYQPMSQIIHFEGVTSGRDINQSPKSYQVKNCATFYQKWQQVLRNHGHVTDPLIKDRYVTKRLLFIDLRTPRPDMDSGSIDSFNYMKIFQSLSFQVTFIPFIHFDNEKSYIKELQRIGIECLYEPFVSSLNEFLISTPYQFNVVVLSRVTIANDALNLIKKYCSNARIIFNPVDLHFLREEREAELFQSTTLCKQAKQIKEKELLIAKKSDCTIVLSDVEKEILINENPDLNVKKIPFVSNIQEGGKSFEARHGILFIGNFQHQPNSDAILFFLDKIWPLIQLKLPDIQLYIIGPNAFELFESRDLENVQILGHVKNISPNFHDCKLSIAPLRYGAGLKGKIRTSLSYGLPIVATPIAVESFPLTHRKDVLVAGNEHSFADAVIELYTSKTLWETLSHNGMKFVARHFSIDSCRQAFIDVFQSIDFEGWCDDVNMKNNVS
jgi:GT2 family glycosyltransferase